jgi:hypothetical protein
MISHIPLNLFAWLIDSSHLTTLGPPPKNPHDDDEDEESEEDEQEENEEPAIIREPDEC